MLTPSRGAANCVGVESRRWDDSLPKVDGGYHRSRQSLDARRDLHLTRMGYRVLRLEADVLRTNIPALDQIRAALA